jgi:hypothetical protein
MPPHLQQAIEEALTAMRSDLTHELNWRYRRAIYKTFGDYEVNEVRKARNWLAILTAQKVLPIFTTLVPWEPLPLLLLSAALKIVLREHDEAWEWEDEDMESTLRVHDLAYHAFGNTVAWDPFVERFFRNAEYAGFASYKALGEVLGNEDPFEHIGHFSRSKDGAYGAFGKRSGEDWIGGEEFADVDMAHLAAVGDTAATAAIGYSCSEDSRECDPKKLREFWEWWLIDAIPLSRRYAINFLEWANKTN